MTGQATLVQDWFHRLLKDAHVRLRNRVDDLRGVLRLFQESGLLTSLFSGSFQRDRKFLTIRGWNRPHASEHKQNGEVESLHTLIFILTRFGAGPVDHTVTESSRWRGLSNLMIEPKYGQSVGLICRALPVRYG